MWLPNHEWQHIEVDAMVDFGKHTLVRALGNEMLPCQYQISTAAMEGELQVVVRISSLKMQVSPTLILTLQEIIVECTLTLALNLGGFFLRELGTQLLFDGPELIVWIS